MIKADSASSAGIGGSRWWFSRRHNNLRWASDGWWRLLGVSLLRWLLRWQHLRLLRCLGRVSADCSIILGIVARW